MTDLRYSLSQRPPNDVFDQFVRIAQAIHDDAVTSAPELNGLRNQITSSSIAAHGPLADTLPPGLSRFIGLDIAPPFASGKRLYESCQIDLLRWRAVFGDWEPTVPLIKSS